MSEFSLAGVLNSRRGEDLELWARTINPQFVRVLRTIGFDRTWARAEGAYFYDADGTRYLDLLGGFGMYGVGRNNPRLRAALVEALELETPGMLAMGTTLLPIASIPGVSSSSASTSAARKRGLFRPTPYIPKPPRRSRYRVPSAS